MTKEISQAENDEQAAIAAMTFEPEITEAQLQKVADTIRNSQESSAAWLRASLAVLAKSSNELVTLASDDVAQAFDTTMLLIEGIDSTVTRYEQEMEFLEAAKARCWIMASKHAEAVDMANAGN